MRTYDVIVPKGYLQIIIYDRFKRKLWEWIGKNLVVNLGRDTLAKHIGGYSGASDNLIVRWLRVGTDNGTILPLDVTNTDLGAWTGSDDTYNVAVSYPADMEVKFTATIGLNEPSGGGGLPIDLKEAGLFFGPADMSIVQLFSRKIHPTITKTSSIQLEYNWTIKF